MRWSTIHIGSDRFVVMCERVRAPQKVVHIGLSTLSTYAATTYTVTPRCVRGRNLVYLSPPHGRGFLTPILRIVSDTGTARSDEDPVSPAERGKRDESRSVRGA
jgi:hypothetical protein